MDKPESRFSLPPITEPDGLRTEKEILANCLDSKKYLEFKSRHNPTFKKPTPNERRRLALPIKNFIEPLPLLKDYQRINAPEHIKRKQREKLESQGIVIDDMKKRRVTIERNDFIKRQLDTISSMEQKSERMKSIVLKPLEKNSKFQNVATQFNGMKNMLQVIDVVRTLMKDGFLYMVPNFSTKCVEYHFYNLKVVSFEKIDRTNYCTISSHGVCRVRSDDETEFIKLDRWEMEILSFNQLRKIKLFSHYRTWKAFNVWKTNVRHKKTTMAAQALKNNLFILKDSLRPAILNVREMCYRISDMGLCKLNKETTYHLEDFIAALVKQISQVCEKLEEFHDLVKEVIRSACRTALLEEGFTPDDYFYDTIGGSEYNKSGTCSSSYIMQSNYDVDVYAEAPDKMTYTEQSKKRSHCMRLTNFIRLADYLIVTTLHVLSANSITMILSHLSNHLDMTPKKEEIELWVKNISQEKSWHRKLSRDVDNEQEEEFVPSQNILKSATIGGMKPLFVTFLQMDKSGIISFEPGESLFHKKIDSIIEKFKQAVLNIRNLVPDSYFDAFTRPIINNKFEEKTCGAGPSLQLMFDDDRELNNICSHIHDSLAAAFAAAQFYASTFDSIATFYRENEQLDLEQIKQQPHDIDFFSQSLILYHRQHEIATTIIPQANLGLFLIDAVEAKENIIPSPLKCISVINEILPIKARFEVDRLNVELQDAEFKLEMKPSTTIDYVNSLNFLDVIQERIEPLQNEARTISDMYDLIEFFQVSKLAEDKIVYETLIPSINNVLNSIDRSLADRDQNLDRFCTKMEKDISELKHEVKELKSSVQNPILLDINGDRVSIKNSLNHMQEGISKLQQLAFTYKSYQKNFNVEVSKYEEMESIDAELKLKQLLWASIEEWSSVYDSWLNVKLDQLNPEELGQIIKKFQKTTNQMRDKLPTITNLLNQNFKDRHWENISKVLECEFTSEEPMTLEKLIGIDAFEQSESINEIAGQASSEASLELLLNKVEDSWKQLEFNIKPFKEAKDVYILGGTDDIQMNLENSNIAISTIASSRYVGPIKRRVDELGVQLDLFSKTLDEWLLCQKNWLYLESIFSAPDIQRQLPTESKMFLNVDKSYKLIMRKANKLSLAIRAGTQPGLLDTLQNNNLLLDQILKCLEAYLESKRMIFPRFYFLSNDELLEILAQTRNPLAVQPHLRKCFDAISSLEFGKVFSNQENTEDELGGDVSNDDASEARVNSPIEGNEEQFQYTNDIIALLSPEGERVEFGKGLKARNNVEEWLGKVELAMFATLKSCVKYSLSQYDAKSRTEWVFDHASQIILTVSQTMWSRDVTEILTNEMDVTKSLEKFEKSSFKNLTDLAALVRTELGEIDRIIICSLITIDVHALGIVSEMKENTNININSFEWQKQMRYYWDSNIDNCVVKMSNSSYTYGYEYLGATARLVITPLTDRCYLCLMGALQLNLGGAPAGPAGTGKTETTKDLAKGLAKQCVVFNCSDGLDYKMMGRFFAGLAQSGAWCCFDEFNRIYIEVLSVIAQQLITIRNAKLNALPRFMFEGREIKLNPDCAAFITMNPGYAGRTELPDNLKALFRPISMMVPEYRLIAEVILYSEGFESSKTLALKMTQMYKLCSEQLSNQSHYDFGMRAVKSVLVMAGSLKRQNPDKNEEVVLIRALRDANVPKFLKDDAVLFNAILQDLFPGVSIPPHDYGILKSEIENVLAFNKKQIVPEQVAKVIQLYETMIVRHGVMLVGPTGSGKTTVYQTLAETCISLHEQKEIDHFFVPVHIFLLNPKSITMGELYGEYNRLTLEWVDGLMGLLVRSAVRDTTTDHQWIVCDGPVDALWIENMNTVLDDNKMLCLANSERIKFTPYIHMLFEVEDLKEASPATVSRCGMVYCDVEELTWINLVKSWITDKMSFLPLELQQYLTSLFETYINDGLKYINNLNQVIKQVGSSKVVTLMKLIDSILLESKDKLNLTLENPKVKYIICTVFVFCYLWSLGGNLTEASRDQFDTFVRQKFEDVVEAKVPTSSDMWSYYFDVNNVRMESWERLVPLFLYKSGMPFFDILVPTIDTVRYGYFFKKLLGVHRSILFTGESGVGKSVIARRQLDNMTEENIVPVYINFSAQTTAGRTQEMIEAKIVRKSRNEFGAPEGKQMIIFVDDINMPKYDTYGSQPPIELLRQFQDFRGFYDKQFMFWKSVQTNVTLAAACGPPGGGRNNITNRFMRHFSVFSISVPSNQTLQHIFSSILVSFFDGFNIEVKQVVENIVNVAVEMYMRINSDLLPTPTKSHYIFNLRDLSKCIQGLTRADSSIILTQDDINRLFMHESLRVFSDRLVDYQDKSYFINMLVELISKSMNVNNITPESLESNPILFGDYLNVNSVEKLYENVHIEKAAKVFGDYLDEYNFSSPKEMKLVFFTDAIEHLSRIIRIIRQPRGNALLVGVSGTGKQSLSTLASFVCEYNCFQIELTKGYDFKSFHEDLRKLYDMTAIQNKHTVFLFTDSQIISEDFLEDINNILNSGQVPNLFDAEEYEKLIIGCRAAAKEAGISEGNREAIFNFAISRVRTNLHVVLSMSPVGDDFRLRCLKFPSLVNCCTIDWFTVWPQEALLSVSKSYLVDVDIGSDEVKDCISEMCAEIHLSVGEAAEKFYQQLRRRYYTTPTSYLELLNLYTNMMTEKKRALVSSRNRLSSGLQKLIETNVLVDTMKDEMIILKPELETKSKDTESLMEKLIVDQDNADAVRKIVAVDEAKAADKSRETQSIAEDAQRDLNEALPALESAVKALDALDKSDISEIRVFQKPPELVQTVMEAVCVLLNAKPDWATAKNVLGESNFLRKLYDYDKDNIPDSTLRKLKKYIDNPKFTPEAVDRVSKAAKSLCMWVRAINLYAHVFQTVEPKRQKLAEAEREFSVVQSALKVQQDKLAAVESEIVTLQQTYETSVGEKHSLEKNMALTQARIKRAGKLTSALADENDHWKASVARIEIEITNVVGDVFISAACIAYYGAFTSTYRQDLVRQWACRLKQLEIPVSEDSSLVSVMGSAFEIRQWNIESLPKDHLSTENAIIVTRSRRWPLMIDPQEQAYRWITTREAVNNLKIVKMTDPTFLSTIENCIRIGIPVLVQDVGETIDPAIEPVLAKQTFVLAGRTLIRLGDSDIDYDPNFRFYMTTKMPNPHYLPEVCIKVTIINFTVTQSGLEDQLLSDVVGLERPELEEQRNQLIIKINNDKNQLNAIEARILKLLFESEGNILDNEELINTLNDSKITSSQITVRLAEAEQTEKKISMARDKYRPVATRGSVMYFIVAQLTMIDKMYQFSLKYFKSLFIETIQSSEKSKDLAVRLKTILDSTAWDVYRNIARGLFENDKLMFSFMLCTEIMKIDNEISPNEWVIYLRGCPEVDSTKQVVLENPYPKTVSQDKWNSALFLHETIPQFKNVHLSVLKTDITITLGKAKIQLNPWLSETLDYNIDAEKDNVLVNLNSELTLFQKLILVKLFDEKSLVNFSAELVKTRIGSKFVESLTTDMQALYKDINNSRPLIFVLSPGSDPMNALMRFAKDVGYDKRVHAVSLGQGQGPVAEKLIEHAVASGDWIYLQNCHLAASWMIAMENIVKYQSENPDKLHEDYRLFLSSMPSDSFPISVLQNSAKVTNEPPKGIKANLKKAFNEMTVHFYEENVLGLTWRKLIFSVCFFHSVILERKKFGPLGWNIKYEFNDSDRETALLNFQIFCDDDIPWDALTYITSEITYGGRVTDYWDQRCLRVILSCFFNENCVQEDYVMSQSGLYYSPNVDTIKQTVQYIDTLPINDDPEVFSMHENANITYQLQEAHKLLDMIISIQPQVSSLSGGKSNNEIVYEMCESFESTIAKTIDIENMRPEYIELDDKGRVSSLTTVLIQERDRFNNLLSLLHRNLNDVKKAIKGFLVMNTTLEAIYTSFLNNKIPDLWSNNCYPSLKNLASWVDDLVLRVHFITHWIEVEIPKCFWISGFFSTQGFLTAVLQSHARKYSDPIDHLSFRYNIMKDFRSQKKVYQETLETKFGDVIPMDRYLQVPKDGVLVYGLYMDGFRWDSLDGKIQDSMIGNMISQLPLVHMLPQMDYVMEKGLYQAPLYKTSNRYGILTTTGHSTNFVVAVNLPTDQKADYWILKGSALLCQED